MKIRIISTLMLILAFAVAPAQADVYLKKDSSQAEQQDSESLKGIFVPLKNFTSTIFSWNKPKPIAPFTPDLQGLDIDPRFLGMEGDGPQTVGDMMKVAEYHKMPQLAAVSQMDANIQRDLAAQQAQLDVILSQKELQAQMERQQAPAAEILPMEDAHPPATGNVVEKKRIFINREPALKKPPKVFQDYR